MEGFKKGCKVKIYDSKGDEAGETLVVKITPYRLYTKDKRKWTHEGRWIGNGVVYDFPYIERID